MAWSYGLSGAIVSGGGERRIENSGEIRRNRDGIVTENGRRLDIGWLSILGLWRCAMAWGRWIMPRSSGSSDCQRYGSSSGDDYSDKQHSNPSVAGQSKKATPCISVLHQCMKTEGSDARSRQTQGSSGRLDTPLGNFAYRYGTNGVNRLEKAASCTGEKQHCWKSSQKQQRTCSAV